MLGKRAKKSQTDLGKHATNPDAPPGRRQRLLALPRHLSLLGRIVLLVGLLSFLVLFSAGVANVSVMESQITKQVDDHLYQVQRILQQPNSNNLSDPLRPQQLFNGTRIQLYTPEGTLIHPAPAANSSGSGAIPFPQLIDSRLFQEADEKPLTLAAGDGSPFRVLLIRGEVSSAPVIAALASPLSEAQNTVSLYRGIYIWFAVVLAVLAVLGSYLFGSGILTQFRVIGQAARSFANGDYSQRLSIDNAPKEVAEISSSLNLTFEKVGQVLEQREHIIKQMRSLLGDASHELRTPLVSIRGYAELYRRGVLTTEEEVRDAMRRVEEEAIRMGLLVEDLLSLTRLDEHSTLEFDEVDVRRLVADAVMDAGARSRGRAITTGFGPGSYILVADENRLRQLLTNLLSNAVRYTPEGTPIEVLVEPHSDRLVLAVQDHGPGISPPLREKVFGRFWRADTSRNRETGGTGLGLAIVLSIVRAHGGSVEVLETPGGGATFRIALPRELP